MRPNIRAKQLPFDLCVLLALALPQSPSFAETFLFASGFTGGVRQIDVITGEHTSFAFGSGLNSAEGLDFGPDGHLYVVNRENASVLRYNRFEGSFIDVFVSEGSGGLRGPHGMVFGPDDNMYVASTSTAQVLRYDGRTGDFIDVFADEAIAAKDLVFGPDGNLYVSTTGFDSVLRFDGQTGSFIDEFVPSRSGGLRRAVGLAFGPDGNLYVSSMDTDRVLRYDGQDGAFIDTFITEGSGGLDRPGWLIFDPTGGVIVGSTGANDVLLQFDSQTGEFIRVFADIRAFPTAMVLQDIIAVPTLSAWNLTALMLLVLATGTVIIRRYPNAQPGQLE